MAQISNGILGEFTGRVGPVSGYTRYGRNIMRTSANNVSVKATAPRVAQREKIKLCNRFMNAFTGKGFFTKSFPAYGHGGSGYNRAMGCLMNKAIKGTYPGMTICYPLVVISHGPLPSAENATAIANGDGNISFSWTDNSDTGTAKPNDKVILVAYFPSVQQVIFSLDAGTRDIEHALLETNTLKGHSAETWMGFLTNDENDAADSVYTGGVSL
jgi:Family of unknown function (DUF6266)